METSLAQQVQINDLFNKRKTCKGQKLGINPTEANNPERGTAENSSPLKQPNFRKHGKSLRGDMKVGACISVHKDGKVNR